MLTRVSSNKEMAFVKKNSYVPISHRILFG